MLCLGSLQMDVISLLRTSVAISHPACEEHGPRRIRVEGRFECRDNASTTNGDIRIHLRDHKERDYIRVRVCARLSTIHRKVLSSPDLSQGHR